jgi:hypothetical protein
MILIFLGSGKYFHPINQSLDNPDNVAVDPVRLKTAPSTSTAAVRVKTADRGIQRPT